MPFFLLINIYNIEYKKFVSLSSIKSKKFELISPSLVKGLGLILTTVLVIVIGRTNPVPLPPKNQNA